MYPWKRPQVAFFFVSHITDASSCLDLKQCSNYYFFFKNQAMSTAARPKRQRSLGRPRTLVTFTMAWWTARIGAPVPVKLQALMSPTAESPTREPTRPARAAQQSILESCLYRCTTCFLCRWLHIFLVRLNSSILVVVVPSGSVIWYITEETQEGKRSRREYW